MPSADMSRRVLLLREHTYTLGLGGGHTLQYISNPCAVWLLPHVDWVVYLDAPLCYLLTVTRSVMCCVCIEAIGWKLWSIT